jgi:hypothetical protein
VSFTQCMIDNCRLRPSTRMTVLSTRWDLADSPWLLIVSCEYEILRSIHTSGAYLVGGSVSKGGSKSSFSGNVS